jgi:DNA-binding Xre family transcriptional regulator
MKQSPWRFEVDLIDRGILIRYMEFRDLSCKTLADKVGCSKATIGHLRSGHTKSLRRSDWAKAIERELNVPPGSLFEPKVYRVSENAA